MTSARPTEPIRLWFEHPLVEPDREYVKDQRVHAVDNPVMIPFWPEVKPNGSAILIFPGGGYRRLSIGVEGCDIARWFNKLGMAAFVVKYRMLEYGFPAPLLDGLRALRLLRQNALDWGLNPNKLGVIGFSAGGHLAAFMATQPRFSTDQQDLLGSISARPDFAVLAYPVITFEGEDVHIGSRNALLGIRPDPELVRLNSLQFQVTPDVPPIFIQHGIGDETVPVRSSLTFFNEVQKYNKYSEIHIYQSNIHGVGMIQEQGTVSSWPNALSLWLQQNQLITPR